jgi:hypothetical protein
MLSITDEGTIKTQTLNVVFTGVNRVYRLEIQSVMLVFSTPLVNCCPPTFSLTTPTPPPPPPIPSQSKHSVWGVLSCVVDHILQEFNTLWDCFWPYSEPTKLLHHPKLKPVKTTFMYWCLYSSFVQAFNYLGGKGWAAVAALPAVSTCPAQRRPPARQQGCGHPTTPTSSPVLIHLRRGGSHDSPPQAQRENSGRRNAILPLNWNWGKWGVL